MCEYNGVYKCDEKEDEDGAIGKGIGKFGCNNQLEKGHEIDLQMVPRLSEIKTLDRLKRNRKMCNGKERVVRNNQGVCQEYDKRNDRKSAY